MQRVTYYLDGSQDVSERNHEKDFIFLFISMSDRARTKPKTEEQDKGSVKHKISNSTHEIKAVRSLANPSARSA